MTPSDAIPALPFPTAIVLAGGRGTRISHLFPELPKPLIPTAGKPFLHWITAWLMRHGARDIVYSNGYRADAIADWVATQALPGDVRLRCRVEAQPLGTGGGVLNCLDLCGETIAVTNGDSLADCDLAAGFRRFASEGLDGMMFGIHMDDASRYGTLSTNQEGRLTAFHEKRPGSGLINAGLYIFRTEIMRQFDATVASSIEIDLIPELVRQGHKIGVYPSANAAFIDIGTPETVAEATAFIESHRFLFDAAQ